MSVVTMRRAGTVVVAAAAVIWADPSSLDAAGEQRVRQVAAAASVEGPTSNRDGASAAPAGAVAAEPSHTTSPER